MENSFRPKMGSQAFYKIHFSYPYVHEHFNTVSAFDIMPIKNTPFLRVLHLPREFKSE